MGVFQLGDTFLKAIGDTLLPAKGVSADEALQNARPDVRDLVARLTPIACRTSALPVVTPSPTTPPLSTLLPAPATPPKGLVKSESADCEARMGTASSSSTSALPTTLSLQDLVADSKFPNACAREFIPIGMCSRGRPLRLRLWRPCVSSSFMLHDPKLQEEAASVILRFTKDVLERKVTPLRSTSSSAVGIMERAEPPHSRAVHCHMCGTIRGERRAMALAPCNRCNSYPPREVVLDVIAHMDSNWSLELQSSEEEDTLYLGCVRRFLRRLRELKAAQHLDMDAISDLIESFI